MTNRRKIIGFKGIADYLGTSVSTVWAWSRTGKIRLYARKEANGCKRIGLYFAWTDELDEDVPVTPAYKIQSGS